MIGGFSFRADTYPGLGGSFGCILHNNRQIYSLTTCHVVMQPTEFHLLNENKAFIYQQIP